MMPRQYKKIAVQEAKIKSTGELAVAVGLPQINAWVVMTSPEELKALSNTLDKWAATLERDQRSRKLVVPASTMKKVDALVKAGELKV